MLCLHFFRELLVANHFQATGISIRSRFWLVPIMRESPVSEERPSLLCTVSIMPFYVYKYDYNHQAKRQLRISTAKN